MRWIYGLLLLTCCAALAQESQLKADFKGEGERGSRRAAGKFSPSLAMGCGQLLFTDHPLHIAVGSIAPQNGFAAGGAFVGHWTPGETLRTSLNADAVASMNNSWRAGGYAKLIYTPVENIHVDTSGKTEILEPERPSVYRLQSLFAGHFAEEDLLLRPWTRIRRRPRNPSSACSRRSPG